MFRDALALVQKYTAAEPEGMNWEEEDPTSSSGCSRVKIQQEERNAMISCVPLTLYESSDNERLASPGNLFFLYSNAFVVQMTPSKNNKNKKMTPQEELEMHTV